MPLVGIAGMPVSPYQVFHQGRWKERDIAVSAQTDGSSQVFGNRLDGVTVVFFPDLIRSLPYCDITAMATKRTCAAHSLVRSLLDCGHRVLGSEDKKLELVPGLFILRWPMQASENSDSQRVFVYHSPVTWYVQSLSPFWVVGLRLRLIIHCDYLICQAFFAAIHPFLDGFLRWRNDKISATVFLVSPPDLVGFFAAVAFP